MNGKQRGDNIINSKHGTKRIFYQGSRKKKSNLFSKARFEEGPKFRNIRTSVIFSVVILANKIIKKKT